MKHLFPAVQVKRKVKHRLYEYFDGEEIDIFNAAINMFCEFYEILPPTVAWYIKLDDPKVAGLTYSTGKIELFSPAAWKKNKKYFSKRRWVEVVFHELYHFLYWVDDEKKADEFAKGMMTK